MPYCLLLAGFDVRKGLFQITSQRRQFLPGGTGFSLSPQQLLQFRDRPA